MKKIALLLSAIMVACILFVSCATTDEKQVTNDVVVTAQYNPATDAPMVELTAYESGAQAYLVQDTGETVETDSGSKLDFSTIFNIVLSVLSVVLAGFLTKFKLKLSQLVGVATAVLQAGVKIDEALKDNNVSKDEIASIRESTRDVRDKFKELINFKKKE